MTKGPWRIGDAGTTVFGPANGGTPEIVATKLKRDNARLVRSAPELLAACKRVLRAVRWAESEDRMEADVMADMLQEVIRNAE
jgi:uncharacterized protein (UPF0210 family)